MAGVLTLLILLSIVGLLWGLISPGHLSKTARLSKSIPRLRLGLGFGFLTLLLFIVLGVTSPAPKPTPTTLTSSKTESLQAKQPDITTKTVTETQAVAFTTETQSSSSLAKGQTKIIQTGQNGTETLTYKITYTDGRQTTKSLVSTVVTTSPIQEIIEDDTYVAPAPTPAPPVTTPAPSAPSSCHPLSNEGTCYKAGEFCRASDAGTSGVASNGESITCENNNGLRWEPAN